AGKYVGAGRCLGLTHDLALAVQDSERAFLHRNVDTDVVHGWSSGLMRRCTVAPQDSSILAEPEPARRNDPILVTTSQAHAVAAELAQQTLHCRRRVRDPAVFPHLAAQTA